MPQLTADMLSVLLSNCIKQFGTENTLKLEDQQLGNPSVISLHPGQGYAILVLLEGQTQIDQWNKTRKEMEDKDVEISERQGEPEPENEQPGVLEAGSGEDPVWPPTPRPSDS